MSAEVAAGAAGSPRLHYIDWLRVLAVLLLFPFHTSRVFNAGQPFYTKATHLSAALNIIIGFIDIWHMPLLFLLAGASTFFALGKRRPRVYVVERVKRLFVPLLFGTLVLIPPQTYIGARFNSGYGQTFVRYLTSGDFLRWNVRGDGDYYGGFGMGHLWFILFLLAICLAALPLLMSWRTERGSAWVARLSDRLASPLWWLLPGALIFIGDALPGLFGKNPFFYLVFFLLGYVAFAGDSFPAAAERSRWAATAAGSAICAAYMASSAWHDSLPDPSWTLTAVNLAGFTGIWVVLVGLIGLGRRHLDRPSPALSYLAEASYPLYILHQTVIVVAASSIVRLPVAWPVGWTVLLAVAIAVSFALYEGVRRIGVLRFLFGMRPAPRPDVLPG